MKKLKKGISMLLSVTLTVSLITCGFTSKVSADTAMQWNNAELGDLSKYYETGSIEDPGIVSTVSGDSGGKSYGAYMFASNAGTPHLFAEWLKSSTIYSVYNDIGNRLDDAYHYISDGYGTYFDSVWHDMADLYGTTFLNAQRDYVKVRLYDSLIEGVKAVVPSFDIDNYSIALKNVFWSRAVQHGTGGACNVITRAFGNIGGFANQPEDELITAIYKESSKLSESYSYRTMEGITAKKYGVDGESMAYYNANSGAVQMSVYRRLAINEFQDALVMHKNNGYGNASIADGYYQIVLGANGQTQAIDVSSGSGNVQTKDKSSPGQKILINYYASGYYTLSIGGNRISSNPDGLINLAQKGTGYEQMWSIIPVTSGYALQNRATGKYLSRNGASLVGSQTATEWQFVPTDDNDSWILNGIVCPSKDAYLMEKESAFPVRGVISNSALITNVSIIIYNTNGIAVVSKSVSPYSMFYDLKKMDNSISISKLQTGTYKYVISAATNNAQTELVSSEFEISPYDKELAGDETFTITFETNGGTINGSTVRKIKLSDITYGILPTATITGGTFMGWFTSDGREITANTAIAAANITLYAHFANTHTYKFLDANGSVFKSGTVSEGGIIPMPTTVPIKSPTTKFDHWENFKFGITLMGTEDMVFNPVFVDVQQKKPTGNTDGSVTENGTSQTTGGSVIDVLAQTSDKITVKPSTPIVEVKPSQESGVNQSQITIKPAVSNENTQTQQTSASNVNSASSVITITPETAENTTQNTNKNENLWTGISVGTNVENMAGATVYNGNAQLTGGQVGTGMSAIAENQKWSIVVTGDINGDGKCTISDIVKIQLHIVGKTILSGAYFEAADVNNDGRITVTDLVIVARKVISK